MLTRQHTFLAPEAHVAAGGKAWDTVKPLAPYFSRLHRVLLVDDDAHKRVAGEERNMLLMPRWLGDDQADDMVGGRGPGGGTGAGDHFLFNHGDHFFLIAWAEHAACGTPQKLCRAVATPHASGPLPCASWRGWWRCCRRWGRRWRGTPTPT